MEKAKELKEEKQKLEDKAFKNNANWKPKLTTPQEPKLSTNRNDRAAEGQNIKALNKPVSIYRGYEGTGSRISGGTDESGE